MYELKPIDNRKSFYGKACVSVRSDNVVILRSYATDVCAILSDGSFIRLWNGYSATTARHIDAFRVDNGLYKIAKRDWLNMPVDVLPAIE